LEEPWCEFVVCSNPNCAEIIKKEGARSLFGQHCKCPHCGHEWVATWAHYKRCSEKLDWHLMAHQEFYRGQTTLDEFCDHQITQTIGEIKNDN